MASVTASIEIASPVASVWRALVDASAYSGWHPCFPYRLDAGHQLRSGDHLTAILPLTDGRVPLRAMVLEVRRNRTITCLLLPETGAHRGPAGSEDRLDLADVGLYRVDVHEITPGRTVVVQRLRLGFALGGEQADGHELARLLDSVQEALRRRVERAAVEALDEHQITGSIRVTSRFGSLHRGDRRGPGLLSGLADWAAYRPGGAAA